jgi:hypothetical protein
VLFLDEILEDHEVVNQDLIHRPNGLEGMKVVLRTLALEVRGFAYEMPDRRVDGLPALVQHLRYWILSEPVNLDLGLFLAELVRDRDISERVTKPYRR